MPPPGITHWPKQIHINSADGHQYTTQDTSELYFFFRQPLFSVTENTDVYVSLVNISIPYVFPNVSIYNNVFAYQFSGFFQTEQRITIPVGQYNVTQLLAFLNSNAQLQTDGFSFTYSPITRLVTIASTVSNFTVTANNTLDLGLGSTLTSSGYSLTATKVLNLLATRNIYVDMCEFSTDNIITLTGKTSAIVARVPIAGEFGTMLNYVNTTGYYSHITQKSSGLLHMRLLDDKGRLLQMNGTDWSATLEIYYVAGAKNNNLLNTWPKFSWQE